MINLTKFRPLFFELQGIVEAHSSLCNGNNTAEDQKTNKKNIRLVVSSYLDLSTPFHS